MPREPAVFVECDCGLLRTPEEAQACPVLWVVRFDDGREPSTLEKRLCTCGGPFFLLKASDGTVYTITS